MNAPYIANTGGQSPEGFYGSGMSSMWAGNEKLGPYTDADAKHKMMPSNFHRSRDFCGTCHDVSNSAVGDLAHNNGAMFPLPAGSFSGAPGAPVAEKAAFKNFPFAYGMVERTFSEHKSSLLSQIPVSDYDQLPEELKAGAIQAAYESAIVAGTGGDYEDGTTRYFTCQTCHMRPVTGKGCNKNVRVRPDLPLHDMTGGNYWMPDVIKYQDAENKLRLGGGLTATQIAALDAGKIRVFKQLSEAVSLTVEDDTVVVCNLTGHKVISGYPEGRRMWLNIKWYDDGGGLVREDGKYGPMTVNIGGQSVQVNTILNLYDQNTKIYEAHYGMTKEWAAQLVALGYPQTMVLGYDRVTGEGNYTLGQLAAQQPGTAHETFHFVLNNTIVKDNRIPPYGMSYDLAAQRNALPVPADQYGGNGQGSVYRHWDEVELNPPAGAVYADIKMLYQPTSWEYVQFLYLANTGQVAFLADEGVNLLDAWLNTGMAEPYAMATATWDADLTPPDEPMTVTSLTTWATDNQGDLSPSTTFRADDKVTIIAEVIEELAEPLSGCQVFMEVRNSAGAVTSLQGFSDANGHATLVWDTPKEAEAGTYVAEVTEIIKSGYVYDEAASVKTVLFAIDAVVGDVNGDGNVNSADYVIVKRNMGSQVTPGTNGDVNLDGKVDWDDLKIVMSLM